MDSFRRFRAHYKDRKRSQRPAKLRKIHDEINDEVYGYEAKPSEAKKDDKEEVEDEEDEEPHQSHVGSRSDIGCTPNVQEEAANDGLQEGVLDPRMPSLYESDIKTATMQKVEETDEVQEARESLPSVDEAEIAIRNAPVEPNVCPDQQALRAAKYYEFEEEDETDYTKGPSRMIDVHDGVDDCVGLLMTLDLSQKIQAAIKSQRRYKAAEKQANRDIAASIDFQMDLDTRISSHEYRELVLRKENGPADELKVVEDELAILRLLSKNTEARIRSNKAYLDNEASNWRSHQAKVNAYLEEAFVKASLLEPDVEESVEEEVPVLTVEGEYAEICRQMREDGGYDEVDAGPLHDFVEKPNPPSLSAEEVAQVELKEEVWDAVLNVKSAQAAFDRRKDDQKREKQANVEAVELGQQPMDENPDAFDRRWLHRVQELTGNLLRAEEALTVAKAKARDAGVNIDWEDQASVFADDVEDGYPLSLEEAMIACASGPKITNWLSQVPSVVDSPSWAPEQEQEQSEDWEAEEAGMSDSLSATADNPQVRKKIDQWRMELGHY